MAAAQCSTVVSAGKSYHPNDLKSAPAVRTTDRNRMTFATKTTCAAAVTAAVRLTLPAAAQNQDSVSGACASKIAVHHAIIRQLAYRVGYVQGFRDGHYAAAISRVPANLQTGRSAYVGPSIGDASATPAAAGGNDVFGSGGVLGPGLFGGNGVLGTGALKGGGALGAGVPGF